MDHQQLKELFELYYNGNATPEQTARLMELIRQVPEAELGELIHEHGEKLTAITPVISAGKAENILQHILGNDPAPARKITWWHYTAAAAAVLALVIGISWMMKSKPHRPHPAVVATDIMPGKEGATLTLGNATVIGLDTAANGVIGQQGNVAVRLVNGQLTYSGNANTVNAPWNTITTGKGNHYSMVLTDGTKVWLNAASSLRFPAAFSGGERKVEVTGEVYFEVAPDPQKPFRVQLPGRGSIEVLGTHFNVHAYNDEPGVATTLFEGAVKVRKDDQQQLLAPGQQAVLNEQPGITLNKQVDLAQVIAWKEGYFWFDDTNIYTLMKQISRWYDVEVRFEGKVTEDGFTGKISRNVPLSQVLQILELYGLHFKITGKQITVMS